MSVKNTYLNTYFLNCDKKIDFQMARPEDRIRQMNIHNRCLVSDPEIEVDIFQILVRFHHLFLQRFFKSHDAIVEVVVRQG